MTFPPSQSRDRGRDPSCIMSYLAYQATWRIICRIDSDAIVIVDEFSKNTNHAAIGDYPVKEKIAGV
jgi:hypothetical protein